MFDFEGDIYKQLEDIDAILECGKNINKGKNWEVEGYYNEIIDYFHFRIIGYTKKEKRIKHIHMSDEFALKLFNESSNKFQKFLRDEYFKSGYKTKLVDLNNV